MTGTPAQLRRYCAALGVTPPATAAQVKAAYRDMAMIWHPDRFAGNERLQRQADARMREINRAYQELRHGIQALPPERGEAARPAQHDSPAPAPPPRGPAAYARQYLVIKLSALYDSVSLPPFLPRPLICTLLGIVFVAAFMIASVRLIESIPEIETPAGTITPAMPITSHLRWLLSGLSWRAPAPRSASALPAPEALPTPNVTRPASHDRRTVTIPGEPYHGADLIVPQGRRGAGVLHIRNTADLDVVVTLTSSRSPRTALRMVYIERASETEMSDIGPGEYLLEAQFGIGWQPSKLTFADSQFVARPAGPFIFVQTQNERGVQGDEYEVRLKRQPSSAQNRPSAP